MSLIETSRRRRSRDRRLFANALIANLVWVAFLCIGIWLNPRAVQAEPDAIWIKAGHGVLVADWAFAYQNQENSSLSAFSLLLNGQYAFSKGFSASLDWGLCGLYSQPDHGEGDRTFQSGNPLLTLRYFGHLKEMRWRVGLGLAAPLAEVNVGPRGRIQRATYNHAAGLRGLWNGWLWAPERLSFAAPFELGWIIQRRWLIQGEAALAGLIPIKNEEGDAELFIQLAGETGYRIAPVEFTLRLQSVIMPTVRTDQAQLSFVPRVRLDLGRFFTSLSFIVNLDGPLGGERSMDRWAINFAGEARYESRD